MRPLLPLVIPATTLVLGIIIGKYLPSTPDATAPKSPSAQEPAMPSQQGNLPPALPKAKRPSRDKVLEMAEMLPEGPQRLAFFENLLSSVKDNPELIKAILANLTPEQTGRIVEKDCGFLTQLDPEVATAFVVPLPYPARPDCVSTIAGAYAQRDLAAAYTWANQLPGELPRVALKVVLSQMTATDAPGAMQKALLITAPEMRRDVVRHVAVQSAMRDAPAAFQIALGIADPEMQTSALHEIIPFWAKEDQEAVQRMLPQSTGPVRRALQAHLLKQKLDESADGGMDYLMTLTHSKVDEDLKVANQSGNFLGLFWGQKDPAAGAAWLGQLPEGKLRSDSTKALARYWTGIDPIAASAWINTLPASPDKDQMARYLAENIQKNDPEAAVVWASQIQDAGVREEAYYWTFEVWLRKDYPAAALALQKVDVPEETKAKWLEAAKPTVDSSTGK